MWYKQDVDILQTSNFLALTDDDVINYDKNGFNIAIALSAYNSEREPFNDPSIGELVFKHYRWGMNADGTLYSGKSRLESHPCSLEELGLDENKSKSRFFPINGNFEASVEFYHKKFLCLNREDLVVYGDF